MSHREVDAKILKLLKKHIQHEAEPELRGQAIIGRNGKVYYLSPYGEEKNTLLFEGARRLLRECNFGEIEMDEFYKKLCMGSIRTYRKYHNLTEPQAKTLRHLLAQTYPDEDWSFCSSPETKS